MPIKLVCTCTCTCICDKICFPRASIPKPFHPMPITLWPSRIRPINWGFAIWWCKRFPPIGVMPWLCMKTWRNSHRYLMLDLHPASDDRYRLFADLLKGQGWTRTFTCRRQDGRTWTCLGWWTHGAMGVRTLPFDWSGVATRQFAPLVASLMGRRPLQDRSPQRRNGRHPVGLGHPCADPRLPPSIPPPVQHNPWIKTSYDVKSICWRKLNNNGIKTVQSKPWHIPIPSLPSIKMVGLPVCARGKRSVTIITPVSTLGLTRTPATLWGTRSSSTPWHSWPPSVLWFGQVYCAASPRLVPSHPALSHEG